jgi:DNA-binding LytR/AlgR family response regulator
VVTFITSVYFDVPAEYWARLPILFPQALIIGAVLICVSMIRDYIKHQNDLLNENHLEKEQQDPANKFMQKLPKKLRGELLCLEMDDHYIKVHTDNGHHMLLMRMKDAISELEGYKGLQAHRSWWVSESAITGSIKEGRNINLNLKRNIIVPVSRTYLPEFKVRNLL